MKGTILIVGSFVAGCVVGRLGWLPNWWLGGALSLVVLYVLMFQVGIGIGSDSRLKEILRSITPRTILVPCATIIGTILSTFLISFALVRWSATEVMAVGCGFGYYSLSSILVSSLKEAHIGLQAAAELGTITLIANVFRELMTLLLAPFMVRWFSPLGPICAGGATTIDVTLPVITRFSGRDWLFVSILHGVVIDFSVPFLVPFFCSFN